MLLPFGELLKRMLPFRFKEVHESYECLLLKTDLLSCNKSEDTILEFLIPLSAPFSDCFVCLGFQWWSLVR